MIRLDASELESDTSVSTVKGVALLTKNVESSSVPERVFLLLQGLLEGRNDTQIHDDTSVCKTEGLMKNEAGEK